MLFRIVVLLAFAFALATPASAHDWYPIECCHQMDCAPVDKAELMKEPMQAGMMSPLPGRAQVSGALIVTTVHGTAIVPPDMVRRESKDSRMHACIRSGKVVCVFVPPGM